MVQSRQELLENSDLVGRVASALLKGEFYEQAGELYERVDQGDQALDCFRKGNAYGRAVELARRSFPSEVRIIKGLNFLWSFVLKDFQSLPPLVDILIFP